MKQKFFAVLTAALLVCVFSCSAKTVDYARKFESVVSAMEDKFSTCTKEEWQELDAKYAELREQYRAEYESLSEDVKSEVGNLMGRYAAVQLKRSAGEVENALSEVAEELKTVTSEFTNIVNGFLGALSGNSK